MRQGGYWAVFVLALVEGIPFIGSLVPGNSIIIAAGFMAQQGVLNVGELALLTIVGSIIGDYIGFSLGRRYGVKILYTLGPYVLLKPEHIEKAQNLIAHHSGASIIAGRIGPFTRAFVPFLIGASRVHERRFWSYDILGCIVWTIGSLAVGYAAGAGYAAVVGYVGKAALFGFIAIGMFIWFYIFVNKRANIFYRYELGTLTVAVAAACALIYLLHDALLGPASRNPLSMMAYIDAAVNEVMAHAPVWLVSVAEVYTMLISPTALVLVATVVGAYLLTQRAWSRAAIVFVAPFVSLGLGAVLKYMIRRPRPVNALIHLTDVSFPSNHAVAATVIAYVTMYLIARRIQSPWKKDLFIVAMVFVSVLGSASRLVLNVHWLSDVLAGTAVGIIGTAITIILARGAKHFTLHVQRLKEERLLRMRANDSTLPARTNVGNPK